MVPPYGKLCHWILFLAITAGNLAATSAKKSRPQTELELPPPPPRRGFNPGKFFRRVPTSVKVKRVLPEKPTGQFTDVNDLVGKQETAGIKRALKGIRKTIKSDCAGKGFEVSVVLVGSKSAIDLDEETVVDGAKFLAEYWGVGKKDCNNEVVLLISLGDRVVGIHQGRGARNLTADRRKAIIKAMQPKLRARDFGGAVLLAVESIGDALARPLYVKKHALDLRTEEDDINPAWFVGGFFVLLIPILLFGETTEGREVRALRRLKRIDELEASKRNPPKNIGTSKDGVAAVPAVSSTECPICFIELLQSNVLPVLLPCGEKVCRPCASICRQDVGRKGESNDEFSRCLHHRRLVAAQRDFRGIITMQQLISWVDEGIIEVTQNWVESRKKIGIPDKSQTPGNVPIWRSFLGGLDADGQTLAGVF